MRSISVEQFRRHLSDVISEAQHGGVTTAVTRHGRPAAVLLPASEHEELRRLRAEEDWRVVRERMDAAEQDPSRLHSYASAAELAEELGLTGDAPR